jgi:hypothetical protein
MTATTKAPRLTNTSHTDSEAVRLLRDAAFALRMTRKVKAELLVERPEIARVAASRTHETAAGLGV